MVWFILTKINELLRTWLRKLPKKKKKKESSSHKEREYLVGKSLAAGHGAFYFFIAKAKR